MFGYTYPGSYNACPSPFYGSSCCPTDCCMPFGCFNGSYDSNSFNGFSGCNAPNYGWNTPSYGWNTPSYGWNTPSYGWNTPSYGCNTPYYGWNTPNYGCSTPSYGWNTPNYGCSTPSYGWNTPSYDCNTPFYGWNSPYCPTGMMQQFQGHTASPWHGNFAHNGAKDDEACTTNNFYAGAYGFGEKTAKSDVA